VQWKRNEYYIFWVCVCVLYCSFRALSIWLNVVKVQGESANFVHLDRHAFISGVLFSS
jgi:hypothetical protein